MMTKEQAKARFGVDFLSMTEGGGPQVRARPGLVYAHTLPHSEVCCHMKVAGKVMYFKLIESVRAKEPWWQYSVQLLNDNGTCFSSAITTGEAGLYNDRSKERQPEQFFYFYPEFPPPAPGEEERLHKALESLVVNEFILCPCAHCQRKREEWAARQPPLVGHLNERDAEDGP